MDYSRILNKPYFVENIDWDNSPENTILGQIDIPTDILINELAKVPFKASVYYRAKVRAIVQTSGTPMHQGCVMVSAVPTGYPRYFNGPLMRNTLMSCPHTFLMANEATPGEIEIPFYVQGKLAAIDLDLTTVSPVTKSDDYATLFFFVWNPLQSPSSGSTSLTISAHFMFTELEFYVPHVDVEWNRFQAQGFMEKLKSSASTGISGLFSVGKTFTKDFLDAMREGVYQWTGLHNAEYAALDGRMAVQNRQNLNLVDTPSYYEKLDPYGDFAHITKDYTFDSSVDEMALSHILKKPQYIGTFRVKSADPTGTLLWSRPITPIQEVYDWIYTDQSTGAQFTNLHTNLIQTLAYMSRFWKGSFKIHIQSVMSNFHYCRLILARDYSPDYNMLTATPDYKSVTNLLTETMEFSAGGQVQTIELPFCSPLNQLPCSTDFVFNAVQHGMYYIYLYQPLVINGSVPEEAQFNIYLSCGDDFDFFGYAVQPIRMVTGYVPDVTALSSSHREEDDRSFEAQSEVTVGVSDQSAILNTGDTNDLETMYDLRPIKSVRDYARRMIRVFSDGLTREDFSVSDGLFSLSVSSLLNMDPVVIPSVASEYQEDVPTNNMIGKLFLGYTGGAKFKVVINGSAIAQVWYVPPGYSLSRDELYWTGTKPVPPSNSLGYLPIRRLFGRPSDGLPIVGGLPTAYSVQTVSVERPNYMYNNPEGMMIFDQEQHRVKSSTCEFEFTIPHMSPYRFVGDYSKWSNTQFADMLDVGTHNMGYLVFKIAKPIPLGDDGRSDSVTIEIYAGISDEGRYGYQVAAPPVILPSFSSGSTPNKSYYQINPSFNPTTNQLPYSTVQSIASSPGLYSIRSCYYAKS